MLCAYPYRYSVALFSTTRIESELPINFCFLLRSTGNTYYSPSTSEHGKLWKDVTVLAGYSPSHFFFFFNCSYHTVQRTWEDWLRDSYEIYHYLRKNCTNSLWFQILSSTFLSFCHLHFAPKFHLKLRGRSWGSFSLSFLLRFFLIE